MSLAFRTEKSCIKVSNLSDVKRFENRTKWVKLAHYRELGLKRTRAQER